jgi:glycosyltransferase involved in cell wall biosynthesis
VSVKNSKIIGWKVATASVEIASVRYRAIIPALALELLGYECRMLGRGLSSNLEGLSALVIVKSFSVLDLSMASKAKSHGIPVIYDLCDNIFLDAYRREDGSLTPREVFELLLPQLTAVVVPTDELAQAILRLYPGTRLYVIPDGIENDDLVRSSRLLFARSKNMVGLFSKPAIASKLLGFAKALPREPKRLLKRFFVLSRLSLLKVKKQVAIKAKRWSNWRFLAKKLYFLFDTARKFGSHSGFESNRSITPLHKARSSTQPITGFTLLWFGNHGADHASFGILDLVAIQKDLEAVAAEFAIELVVVSNSREKFELAIAQFAFKTRYVEWSQERLSKELKVADVVLIPNSLDSFSICKSANRSVTALQAGIPVIATKTKALEPLATIIRFDDFEHHLREPLPTCGKIFSKRLPKHHRLLRFTTRGAMELRVHRKL